MNDATKKILKAYAICAGAGAALFGTFYGLDTFEEKLTNKRKLEEALEESERLRKRLEERLEDAEAQNTILDRRVGILQFENSRLNNKMQNEAKASVVETKKETTGRYPWGDSPATE